MCDFDSVFTGMRNLESNEVREVPYGGNVDGTTYRMNNMLQLDEVHEEGMYYICCTGAYYAYFDGQKWHSCYSPYEDVDGGRWEFTR